MLIASLKKHEGQVVVLDLVQGKEMTTRIKEVRLDDGVVVCSKPMMFIPVPSPTNPTEAQVISVPYGHPMYQTDDEIEVDAGHIFTVFQAGVQQLEVYAHETSSIIPVNAGALAELDRAQANGSLIL